ncbi:MAG: ABC transporter ATP-binding protein [Clostridiales bacterium]|nr:ABC transporter ATP-binding protein [Clostridiales bacterium]
MQFFIRYLRPYGRRITGGLIIKFFGTIMDLFLPWLLAYMLDEVAPTKNRGQIFFFGGVMLLCSIIAWLGNVLANRAAASVARDAIRTVRHDLFKKITLLTSREIDRFTIPSLISRMTTDTYHIYRIIGMAQRMGIRSPILLVGGIIVTMTLDSALSTLLVAMLPFLGLIVWFISKKGVPLYTITQKHIDTLTRIVRENLTGIRIIKALSKTEDEKKRFDRMNETVAASETKAASVMAVNSPTMQFLLNMGLVLVIVVGAGRVDAGLSGTGNIIAFLSYFTIILQAMLTITRFLTMYSKALASAKRVDEVLEGQEEIWGGEAFAPDPKAPHIEFDRVSFSYNKKSPDVKDISFSLKQGQRLGILGPTGAGKSTLIKLLLRLYDVDDGQIRIGGKDIREIPLEKLRQMFGVVFQNDAIFRGNIEDNIRLGRKISLEEMEKAIQDAQAAFIEEKGGVSTPVVSRGQNFSGGQQQRLLLSRALAGTPDILILDDASSALDFKTEAALRAALKSGYEKTTVITIAQRISAIMHCDVILVLEDGQPQGVGTHEELMESCSLYREIAHLQLGGEEE